jgi:hypothetical protein
MADVLIERLAREAGMDPPGGVFPRWGADDAALRRFAALVAEHCAQTVEQRKRDYNGDPSVQCERIEAAAAIRAMFKEPPAAGLKVAEIPAERMTGDFVIVEPGEFKEPR